jgi:hypothetical protein
LLFDAAARRHCELRKFDEWEFRIVERFRQRLRGQRIRLIEYGIRQHVVLGVGQRRNRIGLVFQRSAEFGVFFWQCGVGRCQQRLRWLRQRSERTGIL